MAAISASSAEDAALTGYECRYSCSANGMEAGGCRDLSSGSYYCDGECLVPVRSCQGSSLSCRYGCRTNGMQTGDCQDFTQGSYYCDGTCLIPVRSCNAGEDPEGPGQPNTEFPLDQIEELCDLPPVECGGSAEYCGQIVLFEPVAGRGYVNYPANGETWDEQYRSYVRRDVMMLIKYASAYVDCVATEWATGNGGALGLLDMSEANGDIPGTSIGSPGHPAGTHRYGREVDIAYFQVDTEDNQGRTVCSHSNSDGSDAYHCTARPHLLDEWRSSLLIGALLAHPWVRVIGVDGKVGPIVESSMEVLCDNDWLGAYPCGRLGDKLAYEATNQGKGWYYHHHHHLHLSFAAGTYGAERSLYAEEQHERQMGNGPCLVPDCSYEALEPFLPSE